MSDGTAEGTLLVEDVRPGPIGVGVFDIFATGDGRALFTVNDGTHGFEPWISDGTAEGTYLVADINAGPSSSFAGVGGFANIGDGRILFSASDGTGTQLWVTDGTAQGTVLVKSLRAFDKPINVGGTIYFAGSGENDASSCQRFTRRRDAAISNEL